MSFFFSFLFFTCILHRIETARVNGHVGQSFFDKRFEWEGLHVDRPYKSEYVLRDMLGFTQSSKSGKK